MTPHGVLQLSPPHDVVVAVEQLFATLPLIDSRLQAFKCAYRLLQTIGVNLVSIPEFKLLSKIRSDHETDRSRSAGGSIIYVSERYSATNAGKHCRLRYQKEHYGSQETLNCDEQCPHNAGSPESN